MNTSKALNQSGIVLVTGASGFVGSALVKDLVSRGIKVRGTLREERRHALACDVSVVGEIGEHTDWSKALEQVDCVIHSAGRAHVMRDDRSGVDIFRTVNFDGTLRLAEQAAVAGVRRLVFVSSIKVHGDTFEGPGALNCHSSAAPEDPYGQSKWDAEEALRSFSTDLEIVVVRPPLVYGHGVKGNFARLIELLRSGVPLPLGSVTNRRALVSLDNLVDLLAVCIDHPRAAGHAFLVSDGEDLTTPDLLRRLGRAMGRSPRLIPCPEVALRTIGKLVGKSAEIDRLVGSLPVDIEHTRHVLDWSPVVSVDEGLARIFVPPSKERCLLGTSSNRVSG
jgi:nucleoside-diphosphate-sugar epimerase